jgi:hypothetical protein
MTLAQDHDRIIVAWLSGIARRHASYKLSARHPYDETEAVRELRETANGRDDLLESVAATPVSKSDEQIPYYIELRQEIARLCRLAVTI